MKPVSLLIAFAVPLLTASADAAVRYEISGGGHVAIFNLDIRPTPAFRDAGYSFGVTTIGTFDGVANLAGITFYLDPFEGPADVASGGLTYLDNGSFLSFDVAGPQLFSGTIDAPKLLAFGTRQFIDITSGQTITVTAQAVPEPALWAMMVAGFGLTGRAMRRKTLLAIA